MLTTKRAAIFIAALNMILREDTLLWYSDSAAPYSGFESTLGLNRGERSVSFERSDAGEDEREREDPAIGIVSSVYALYVDALHGSVACGGLSLPCGA